MRRSWTRSRRTYYRRGWRRRRTIGRRYSRQRTGPGSSRQTVLKGTTFFCNVYAAPIEHVLVGAGADLGIRYSALRFLVPADPYCLRINTGVCAFTGDLWEWSVPVTGAKPTVYKSIDMQYLANCCSGVGVSSRVINMRPPVKSWHLTPTTVLGRPLDANEFGKKPGDNDLNQVITTYSGGNNVIQWGQYGQMYDRYYIDYIIFEYVPSCSKMTDGQVTMLWNDNPTDPIPSTMGQYLTNTKCVTTQVYNRAKLVVKPKRWLWTCPQAGNTGVRSLSVRDQNIEAAPYPDRTVDSGWFSVIARTAASSGQILSVVGTIRISYCVRFSKPSINLEMVLPDEKTDGLVVPREIVQVGVPGATQSPPKGVAFDDKIGFLDDDSIVEGRRRLRDTLMSKFVSREVQERMDSTNAMVGTTVMGGGGNQLTVDDQFGSNYVGNPMYYFTEPFAHNADADGDPDNDPGGGDDPDEPSVPNEPTDPIDPDIPPPDVPSSTLYTYGYGRTRFLFRMNNSADLEHPFSIIHPLRWDGHNSYPFETAFDDWSLSDSGSSPMTLSSLLGFMTISNNGDSSLEPGQVTHMFGINAQYSDFSHYDLLQFPPYTCVIHNFRGAFDSGNPLGLNVHQSIASFYSFPSLFYVTPGFTDAPDGYGGGLTNNMGHYSLFFFGYSELYHYGFTHRMDPGPSIFNHGVFRKLDSANFDYTNGEYASGVDLSSVGLKAPSTSATGSSNVPSSFSMGSLSIGCYRFSSKYDKIGLRITFNACICRVAVSMGFRVSLWLGAAWAYNVVSDTDSRLVMLCSMLGATGNTTEFEDLTGSMANFALQPITPVSDTPTGGGLCSVIQGPSVEYRFGELNTFGGLHQGDDLVALYTDETKFDLHYVLDTSTLGSISTAQYVTLLPALQVSSYGLSNVDVSSARPDFGSPYYLNDGTQKGGGAYGYGIVFYVRSFSVTFYDGDAVPQGYSDAQIDAYLESHPEYVLARTGK